MSKKLALNEIFYSVQGEGYWQGMAAVFIRFAGCNLSCEWCDTKYASEVKERLTPFEVAQRVESFHTHNVILTGGEPLIQDELLMGQLLQELRHVGVRHIAMESNGVLDKPWTKLLNWRTISPKRGTIVSAKFVNEIKLVYDGHSEDELEYWELYAQKNVAYLFLQPQSNLPEEISRCIELVKERPQWRLSLQLHRMLNIR